MAHVRKFSKEFMKAVDKFDERVYNQNQQARQIKRDSEAAERKPEHVKKQEYVQTLQKSQQRNQGNKAYCSDLEKEINFIKKQ